MSQQGWECPKCGQVYAPWMAKCQSCSGVVSITVGGVNTPVHIGCSCTCPTDTGFRKIHEAGCPFAQVAT